MSKLLIIHCRINGFLLSATGRPPIRCSVKLHPKAQAQSQPTVYNAWIGELFQYRTFSITHSGGTHPKDMSSAHSASADTESAWVATLSNVFEKRCEFHVFLKSYLGHIAYDSHRQPPHLKVSTSKRRYLVKNVLGTMQAMIRPHALLGMIPPRILVGT
jgi:hypothetical protein